MLLANLVSPRSGLDPASFPHCPPARLVLITGASVLPEAAFLLQSTAALGLLAVGNTGASHPGPRWPGLVTLRLGHRFPKGKGPGDPLISTAVSVGL